MRRGAVHRVPFGYEPVEKANPLQRQSRDPPGSLRSHQSAHHVFDAPDERGGGARHNSSADLLEVTKEIAVTAAREPGEVIRSCVHLLQERGLRVDESLVFDHSVDLGDDAGRLQYVLEHGLDHDRVNAAVSERDAMCICDELRQLTAVDVEREHARPILGIERTNSVALGPTANHEYERVVSREETEQAFDIARRHQVRRRHPATNLRARGRLQSSQRRFASVGTCRAAPTRTDDAALEVDQDRPPAMSGEPVRRSVAALVVRATKMFATGLDRSGAAGTDEEPNDILEFDQQAVLLRLVARCYT